MKSNFRYANSLGKVNERRKRIHDQEVKRKAEQLLERERQANERLSKGREPSLKKYVSWVNPNTMGNYWNSIQDYENSLWSYDAFRRSRSNSRHSKKNLLLKIIH